MPKPALLLVLLALGPAIATAGDLPVYGWLESAYLQPWGVKLKAKLDTGAKTSSIHAVDILPFERDGAEWVRFTLPLGAQEGYDGIVVERPVEREARIKEHDEPSVRRYVVKLEFCLDGHTMNTPMTLADRGNFNYPLLLGRRTLKGWALVDPSATFTTRGNCYQRVPGADTPAAH